MKENENLQDGLYSGRSYIGCINDGMVLATRNVKNMLSRIWKYVVGCGAVTGLLLWSVTVLFSDVAWTEEGCREVCSGSWYYLLLAGIGLLLASSVYRGVLLYVLPELIRKGILAAETTPDLRKVADMSLRSLSSSSLSLLLFTLVFIPLWWFLGWSNLWVWGAFVVLYLAVYLPYSLCQYDQLLHHDHTWVKSLRAIRMAYRYWGAIFMVFTCTFLIRMMVCVLVWFPVVIATWALHDAVMAVNTGDVVADLPVWLPYLQVLLCIVAAILSLLVKWADIFPMTYLYGAIVTREKERRQQA